MSNLLDMLQGAMTENVLDGLSQQIGAGDKQKTAAAASGIFSTLTTALSKNTQSEEGANSLLSALDRDHDGSVLDDVMGLLGGQQSQAGGMERALNGAGILKHVLGGKESSAVNLISQMSGLDKGSTGSLMIKLAPLVLGALGKQKRESGLDAGGLSSLLMNTVKSKSQDRAEMSIVEKMLDADGDGSIMDDLADKGLKLFGRFLKGKR